MNISLKDKNIIRDLAKRVSDIAALSDMDKRRKLWVEHNSLRSNKPMMLIFPEGSWRELLPESKLECESDAARDIEKTLKFRIYTYEHFQDDTVIENKWEVQKASLGSHTGWGIEAKRIPSPNTNGAWHIDPVIKTPSDLKKLRKPEIIFDEKRTQTEYDELSNLFGDILNIEMVGIKCISFHIMALYTALRGLEEVMMDMYLEPNMLHDAMAFFEEGYSGLIKQFVDNNLLSLNNDNSYQNSGGNSFTDELPQKDFNPNSVRLCDMWASAEAQEMAQVSPEHHAEFIMQYEKRLLKPFGLTGYGCCEDLTNKFDDVFTIPQIRRISISPWSDVQKCAEKLENKYIFSWKPNPAHIAAYDTNVIEKYIKRTVDIAKEHGTILEIVLKDTHTCENTPERFDEWTKIARNCIERG